jgi:hypothetical protein
MADGFMNPGYLIPISGSGLNADDLEPQYRPGGISFVNDAFGFRIFKYCQNNNGAAVAVGELMSRPADVAITNIDSGTTTSVTEATGFTANFGVGGLLYIDDNDDSAGAAPEGEVGVVIAVTANTVTIDADRPFTVAPAANDEARLVYTHHFEDSADGDLAKDVQGVVMATGGVTNLYYGWLQCYGYHPAVIHSAEAVVANASLEAGAAEVKVLAGGQEEQVGWQVGTHTADLVTTLSPVYLQLFGMLQVTGTP